MTLLNKSEIKGLVLIFGLLILFTLLSFNDSIERQRDTQRILDLGQMQTGLVKYNKQFGFYPSSSPDGKIIACKGKDTKKIFLPEGNNTLTGLVACEWGKSKLTDATDEGFPPFSDIYWDPLNHKGYSYYYLSNGKEFQLFASLEKGGKEVNQNIKKAAIKCGVAICNLIRGSGGVSLDKPLEI